jgi:hypothetical protein
MEVSLIILFTVFAFGAGYDCKNAPECLIHYPLGIGVNATTCANDANVREPCAKTCCDHYNVCTGVLCKPQGKTDVVKSVSNYDFFNPDFQQHQSFMGEFI